MREVDGAMFLTMNDLRKKYGIPRWAIEKACQDGKLSVFQFAGKTQYIREDNFLLWVESCKVIQERGFDVVRANRDEIKIEPIRMKARRRA